MKADAPWTLEKKALADECRILGQIAGGWWVEEDETCPAQRGLVFITMDRWQKILARSGRPHRKPLRSRDQRVRSHPQPASVDSKARHSYCAAQS